MIDRGRLHDVGGPNHMITNSKPLFVAGGAVYPYSQRLEEAATIEDRFGEVFSLGLRVADGDTLWLPRGMCPPSDDDRRSDGVVVPYAQQFKARNAEQEKIVAEGSKLLATGKNFIIQAPTGWGKTYVGCAIAGSTRRKTLVITTKEDILDQWTKAAREVLGLDASEIDLWRGDDVPAPDAKFVIGLVQSVMKGPERYPDVDYSSFGLVICDEVHRMGAEHFSQAMWWFPAKLRLGLSATPYRKDGRDQVFFGHIGEVHLTARQETMIPRVIVKRSDFKLPRVWRNGHMVKLPHEAGKTMHISNLLGRSVSRNHMIGDFVAAAYRKKRNIVVFADTLEHLGNIEQEVLTRGIPSPDIGYYVGTSISGGSPYKGGAAERKKQRERDKAKSVVLATYAMASEATDVPWWDTCVLATPRSDVVQIVGRIRREYPDKPRPVVLDIVDADSEVFTAYARKRMRWYESLGCEIRVKD